MRHGQTEKWLWRKCMNNRTSKKLKEKEEFNQQFDASE
jgi:hypothetical protein